MPLAPRDLDYFLAIAHRGQLATAATQLDVTAAALSKAVRRLERELGMPVFERSGQGMALTPFGVAFRERAQRLKTEHDDALRFAGDVRAGRAGLLRIGATLAVLDGVVSPAMARLQPRRPGLRAALTVASSDQVLALTRGGGLDVSVVPAYDALPSDLAHRTLGADELLPVVREGHPLARARRLDLARLAACDWVVPKAASAARARFDAAFHAAGCAPPAGTIEVDASSSWALPLVAGTDLVAMVPRSTLARPGVRGVRTLDVAALRVSRTIAVFWRPETYRSPLMDEFVAALPRP